MKLWILAHHDKEQFQDNGHCSDSNIFGGIALFELSILSKL